MIGKQEKIIIALSFITAGLISVCSFPGIFFPGFYGQETLNWQAQSIGQDIINLCLIVPVLIITTLMIYLKKHYGKYLWAGTILYLIYTYLIYCFNIHFNIFFIIYCFILGLCFYLLIYFFYSKIGEPHLEIDNPIIPKLIAMYFLIISVLFYFLWLSEIIPAMRNNTVPKSLAEVGLFTNPVHVIDLSVILPGIFITGILLLRKKYLGLILAPILLMFFILMEISIGALMIIISEKGIDTDFSLAGVMGILTLLSLVMLVFILRNKSYSV